MSNGTPFNAGFQGAGFETGSLDGSGPRARTSPRPNPYRQQMKATKQQYGTANPRKIAKMITMEQLGKFQKDPSQFGMTESDRQRMVGESMQAAGQASAAQQAGMARQGMGQGGFQAGYMQQAARQVGAAPSQAAAQASMRARELGEAKILAKSQELQGRLDEVFRKRLAAQQQTMSNIQGTAEAAGAAAGGAGGMMTGMADLAKQQAKAAGGKSS